jgi:Neuraminidase (sialidase)
MFKYVSLLAITIITIANNVSAQAFGFSSVDILTTRALVDNQSDTNIDIAEGSGRMIVVWSSTDDPDGTLSNDGDILYCLSDDDGVTWSFPQAIHADASSDSLGDSLPEIATDGLGNWVVLWVRSDDILRVYSSDNGNTWSARNNVLPTAASPSTELELKTDRLGNWVVVWNTNSLLVGGDQDIFYSHSSDNGVSWSGANTLNPYASTDGQNDSLPSLDLNGSAWIVAWQTSHPFSGTLGTDNDIVYMRTTDDGLNWSSPNPLNTNATFDSGSDFRPVIKSDGTNQWVAVWSTFDDLGGTIGVDEDITYTFSTTNGTSWNQITPLVSNAITDSGNDTRPYLATDSNGIWLAAWQSTEDNISGSIGTDNDILVARSDDNGTTWTTAQVLNGTASTDSGEDENPKLLSDGAGNWLAVWRSLDSLGGTVGTDRDIFFTQSSTVPVELSQFIIE